MSCLYGELNICPALLHAAEWQMHGLYDRMIKAYTVFHHDVY